MQNALGRIAGSGDQRGSDTERPPSTAVRLRGPLLDSYLTTHGPIKAFEGCSRPVSEGFRARPDCFITPILIAVLCCLTTRQRVESMWRSSVILGKTDPGSATLIICILVAFLRINMHVIRPLSLLGADQVHFDDAFGASLSLPFALCECPTRFSDFVRDHFSTHPCRSFIFDRLYHLNLNNSRGLLVTDRTWSSFIRSNSKITMSITWDSRHRRCIHCRDELFFHEPRDLVW